VFVPHFTPFGNRKSGKHEEKINEIYKIKRKIQERFKRLKYTKKIFLKIIIENVLELLVPAKILSSDFM